MGHGKTLEENFKSGGGDKRKLLKIFLLCMDHSKIILSNNSSKSKSNCCHGKMSFYFCYCSKTLIFS